MLDITTNRWIELIALPLAGALLTHAWMRYRSRLVKLNWSVEHAPLAFGTEDFGLGKVEVRYNDAPVMNIQSVRVTLQNDSNNDLSQVEVNVRFSTGTFILYGWGQVSGSVQGVPYTEAYANALKRIGDEGKPTSAAVAQLASTADYRIPTLNRGGIVTFTFLVSRQDYQTPTAIVAVDHPGVRLVHRPPVPEAFGVRRAHAQVLGTVIGIGAVVAALVTQVDRLWLGLGGWLLGATVLLIGAGAVHAGRAIRRAFG